MTAQILNIRDYQNRKDIERLYAEFGNECAIAVSVALANGAEVHPRVAAIKAGIALIPHDREVDTAPSEYCAPDQDSA